MKLRNLAVLGLLAAAPAFASDPAYVKSVEDWRAQADQRLRKDNGWLTLAGRYVMKPGLNTFGTGERNDIVFPKGLGPDRMGTVTVEPGRVFVKLEPGLAMVKDGIAMTDKVMGTDLENRDWVAMGRAAFHVIERDGKYILRLADNESEVRRHFGGRVWYGVDKGYLVPAKFVAYQPARKIPIVNILDEVSDETAPGYVEFRLMERRTSSMRSKRTTASSSSCAMAPREARPMDRAASCSSRRSRSRAMPSCSTSIASTTRPARSASTPPARCRRSRTSSR